MTPTFFEFTLFLHIKICMGINEQRINEDKSFFSIKTCFFQCSMRLWRKHTVKFQWTALRDILKMEPSLTPSCRLKVNILRAAHEIIVFY